jgi:hypothetical protein
MNNNMKTPSANKPPLEHDEIVQTARRIWEQEGRQAGRDLDYWLQAEAELLAVRQNSRSTAVGVSQVNPKRETTRPLASAPPGPKAEKPQTRKTNTTPLRNAGEPRGSNMAGSGIKQRRRQVGGLVRVSAPAVL